MAQILDPLPNKEDNNAILCCYVNATSQIQVARITNIPNWYFERVVFPGQRLVFEALPTALLEIHTGMMASAILSDTICCQELSVNETQENNEEKQEEPSKEISVIKEEQSNLIINNEHKKSNPTVNFTLLGVSC